MNWLDWVFVLIIGLSAIRGFRAGFLAGAAGIVGLLGGIWAAVKFHGQLAGYLSSQWNWDKKISGFLFSKFSANYQHNFSVKGRHGEDILNTLALSGDVMNNGIKAIESATQSILSVLAFGMIVIVTYIIAGGILKLVSRTVAGTVLSPLDKLGGLVLGLAKGGLFAAVILMALLMLKSHFPFFLDQEGPGFLTLAIQKSQIAPILLSIINSLNLPLPVFDINMAGTYLNLS